jgi:3-methyladenine DNA glycosylase AlkD
VATDIDVGREVANIRAELEDRADEAYAVSMRRLVPSSLPAHAVRVPELRSISRAWLRANSDVPADEMLALAEALWSTGWREERLVAVALIAGRRELAASMPWEMVERWSGQIDNWEQVDHLAGVTGAMLRARPELIDDVERLAESGHSWQRRLSIVTLIEATRKEPSAWRPRLEAIAERLRMDRGPTMRKAVAWARKVLRETETS